MQKLSVVMAAYQEANTVAEVIEGVLGKKIPGLNIELIIIESSSTDGTKEIVRRYSEHDRVTLIFQKQPLGKGNAIREGLRVASGDFVLIQDADLEYDLDDYEALLEPLIKGEQTFVLGARHGASSWKIRRFHGRWFQSFVLNIGHLFFATMINILYLQKMRDPFTMYKVFRRDCLDGLSFECNRFDFDIELVLKLLRSGHRPIELPVNYHSRSFAEGKKIAPFRDSLTWIRAIIKYRFVKIYE